MAGDDQVYGLTLREIRWIREEIRRAARPTVGLVPTATRPIPPPNLQWVKLDTVTPEGADTINVTYDAKGYFRKPDGTFENWGDAWVQMPNGEGVDTTSYNLALDCGEYDVSGTKRTLFVPIISRDLAEVRVTSPTYTAGTGYASAQFGYFDAASRVWHSAGACIVDFAGPVWGQALNSNQIFLGRRFDAVAGVPRYLVYLPATAYKLAPALLYLDAAKLIPNTALNFTSYAYSPDSLDFSGSWNASYSGDGYDGGSGDRYFRTFTPMHNDTGGAVSINRIKGKTGAPQGQLLILFLSGGADVTLAAGGSAGSGYFPIGVMNDLTLKAGTMAVLHLSGGSGSGVTGSYDFTQKWYVVGHSVIKTASEILDEISGSRLTGTFNTAGSY